MSDGVAAVSKFLTWSVVDGPGNRFVLFLQGCNYRCITCHNPHTIGICNDCGTCVAVCPSGALTKTGRKVVHDPGLCVACDSCLAACPTRANPMVRRMTVEDVLALLRRNAPFLNGLTVSGGEATLHLDFLIDLFAAIRAAPDLAHLTLFIDSNGHLAAEGWQRVLPLTDGVMLDIKAFDPDRHRRLTGTDNKLSLASARLLADAGKLYELRFLLVPGETDRPEEIGALAALARELDPNIRLRLNAFQLHGVRGSAATWKAMPRDGVEAAAAALAAAGFSNVAVPSVWLP
ncbi:YjjW family glycine radical enzyme activase [Pleomorphomonas diazotrophica]|uniref:YjjW family glycine radical enzyme activase n=1 Tax=Pleomorphomonas diazotrophica TaxID=1166257 RepID=A0A1I4T0B1_9HYPH|nr:YjjW family glycine radical enzyme activase [Pleomorphomonas diazotrophica]PKR88652.1 YjjW family glycine radical enzyme activase [Pleomorphomonas diazotrophica]SFM70089.1 pyruvate formate lyase activating enzyme [Pleomorphomonas diazotrophica]